MQKCYKKQFSKNLAFLANFAIIWVSIGSIEFFSSVLAQLEPDKAYDTHIVEICYFFCAQGSPLRIFGPVMCMSSHLNTSYSSGNGLILFVLNNVTTYQKPIGKFCLWVFFTHPTASFPYHVKEFYKLVDLGSSFALPQPISQRVPLLCQ